MWYNVMLNKVSRVNQTGSSKCTLTTSSLPVLSQIKALRRERVETILGKEELVEDPAENGIIPTLIYLLCEI